MSLLPHHAELIAKSAIAENVAAARGYWTATTRGELEARGFRPYQALSPALAIPVYDVTGKTAFYQIRPDCPRVTKKGKAIKYETPGGTRMVVDVPPAIRGKLADPTVPLWITEGIRKADAAVSAGLCCVALLGVDCWRGTNAEGGKVALACWDSIALNGRHVFICYDSDAMTKPEVKGARDRLRAFLEQRGARVHLVYLPDGEDGSKVGLDDYLAGHTADELRALADAQPIPKSRSNGAAETKPTRPAPLLAPLLEDVLAFLRRYVVFTKPEQAIAVALWIAHTHIAQQVETTPYLWISSAEKRSGKTRLLDAAELVVAGAWRVVMPSEAVLYRKIEQDAPTLLFDEVDAIYGPKAKEHEGLRALLNAGHGKGGKVARCVGDGSNMRVEHFEVYCPKALAGIGDLPDTIADRSIPIRLARRARQESVARFRYRIAKAEAAPIYEGLVAWAASADLADSYPGAPEILGDRAADCWEPLLAIADAAGGTWPERARNAATVLHADGQQDEASFGELLLLHVRVVFDSQDGETIFTEQLVAALKERDDAPWGEWNKGKGLSPHSLARVLRPFGIRPGGTVRIGAENKKGYKREQFKDAWDRYLPPSSEKGLETSHRHNSDEADASSGPQGSALADGNGITKPDASMTPRNGAGRDVVTNQTPSGEVVDAEGAIGSEEIF